MGLAPSYIDHYGSIIIKSSRNLRTTTVPHPQNIDRKRILRSAQCASAPYVRYHIY